MNSRVTNKFEQELQGLLERSIAATMDTAMQAIAGATKHLGSTVASHVGYSCRNLTPEMEKHLRHTAAKRIWGDEQVPRKN